MKDLVRVQEVQGSKRRTMPYYFMYSILFIVLAGLIYSVFAKNNKSFVYTLYGDGHICFNSFVYYGRWLRHIGMTLLQEHRLAIPMWDMSVGYGSDIVTTFNWMTIGDPLNILSAFVSADSAEYLYDFLAIFRIYLAGLTFSVFGLYQRRDRTAVLCGSLIYAFCGFSLFAGVRDVYFMSPMVYLPLLLLGVDKVFKKEKPYVLVVTAALAGITNFYFFYMLSVWVFIYGIYRYFMLFGKDGLNFRQIAGWLLKCICYYLIGVAVAAFMLFPRIMKLFDSERFAHQDYIPILYSFDYYRKIFIRFITTESTDYWTHLGYTPLGLIAVFVLWIRKDRKYLPYKIAFVMCVLFMMIPAVGSLMNAGSYVTNRWIWAFSMLVAYIFVVIYPELFQLSVKEKLYLILLCCGYSLLCLIGAETKTFQMAVMNAILLMGLLLLLAGDYMESHPGVWKSLVLFSVFAGIAANGILRYAAFGSNYANGFVDNGTAWKYIHDDLPSRSIENMADADIVRYDSLGTLEPMYNTAMNHNLNGTDFYFSLADGNITRFFDELYVNVEMEHRYKGVDERTILERLAGVKYCIVGEKSVDFVPYGYDEAVVSTDQYTVYENKDALGISYTYDSYLPQEEYDELPAVRKQQALLQCAAVESSALRKAVPTFNERELPYRIEGGEGIEVQQDRIVVSDVNAHVTVSTEAVADSEIYLVWDDILYERRAATDWEESLISYTRNQSTKTQLLYSSKHPFYHNRDDYIINMGYTDEDGPIQIAIQFAQPGTYYYNSLTVTAQPMELVDDRTKRLSNDHLDNLVIEDNKISGTLNLGENKLLCMAVPYSLGWSAYIDGEPVETMRVNNVYLGIEVGPGEHRIVFRYVTPGFYVGLVTSLLGVIGLVGIVIFAEVTKRRKMR